MKKNLTKRMMLPLLLTVVLIFSGCSTSGSSQSDPSPESTTESESTTNSEQSVAEIDPSEMFTDRDMEIGYDEETGVRITVSDNGSSCDSKNVNIKDNVVTITDEGTYILSGTLDDGRVVVNVGDKDKVQLVLNNVKINSSTSAPIYVLNADKVFITTVSESENELSNGGKYEAVDENNIDSVIFAKTDLTLNGAGTLTIKADAGHGIVSKDDLVLASGTYKITAASHGISGKNSVRIANGTYTVVSGKDGIHAENADDTSLGFLYIADGTFDITAGDDGMHAASALSIQDGSINITKCYEGIEGLSIDISGGEIHLVAGDDGLNAAGGNDSSGFGGRGGDMFAATEGASITISGGKIYINSSGDGVDSNGSLTVSGGETYVSGSANSGNGALDYNGEAVISGGVFLAAGASGMAQNFGASSTQGTMMVPVDNGTAGSEVSLSDSDGKELLSWKPENAYTSVLLSCPEIKQGSTYTLTADGKATEITMDSLVYGTGSGAGGKGAGKGGGKRGGEGGKDRRMEDPNNQDNMNTEPEEEL